MKRGLIIASLALSTVAIAPHALADGLTGLYAGGALGYGAASTRYNDEDDKTAAKNSDSGLSYEAYAGWGARVAGPLYLGVEVSIGDDQAKTSRTIAGGKVSTDGKVRVTPAARVGYMLSDDGMIFTRLGLQYREYDVKLPNGQSRSKTFSSPVFGVGYEHAVSDNISLRGELSVVGRKSETISYGVGNASKLKIEPAESRFMIGASMHF
jgi:hypothetical protein